jgi:hypothetical protein
MGRAAYLEEWAALLRGIATDSAWREAREQARLNEPTEPRSIPVDGNAWAQNR